MRKKERNDIIKFAEKLTDEQLENEYYDAVYNSLGSQCERMYDLGYDISDILDREEYEKYLGQVATLLEYLCYQRGIKLWGEE